MGAEGRIQPKELVVLGRLEWPVAILAMVLVRPCPAPGRLFAEQQHPALATGRYDLVGAERIYGSVAERSDRPYPVRRAMRLRAILDHLQLMGFGERQDRKRTRLNSSH